LEDPPVFFAYTMDEMPMVIRPRFSADKGEETGDRN
jgi:hypothetical protein